MACLQLVTWTRLLPRRIGWRTSRWIEERRFRHTSWEWLKSVINCQQLVKLYSTKKMVLIVVGGRFLIWETFITTISDINTILTFDELFGKCIQEEARTISRGRISHHKEGESTAFSAYDKRKKGNKQKYAFKSSKGNLDMSKVRCFNCQKHGHFSHDCKERRRAPKFKSKPDYRKDSSENQKKGHLEKQ